MLNILKKTTPWMVASFLVATSAFGQTNNNCAPACPSPKPACAPASCCKPCVPREPLPCPQIAAYNAPARWETRCPWDVWVDGSFLYWQPFQDNMEPAAVMSSATSTDAWLTQAAPGISGRILNLNTKFKPGFKVGIGMNFDHDSWDGLAEYTRFHSTHKSSGSNSVYMPMLLPSPEFSQFASAMSGASVGTNFVLPFAFKESWRLNMDLIDVNMGRWYWVGTALSFRPSVGARGGWINQKLFARYNAFAVDDILAGTASELFFADAHMKTRSWLVGPRVGINTNWWVGDWSCNPSCYDGFRFFGNAFADVVFTRFKTHTSSQVVNALTNVVTNTSNWVQYKLNTIRTHLDLELGIAWGSYFDNNNWHIDLSAGYGFQVFFSQNMFRNGVDSTKTFNPLGDLYIQGLTATARLDF